MKYKLPRQVSHSEIYRIISREMRRQKIKADPISKGELREFAELSKVIQKQGLPPHLVCKKLPHNLGKGIFLHPDADPILQDQLIGPYAGQLSIVQQFLIDDACYAFAPMENMLLSKEEQKLFDHESNFHPRRLYSLKLDAEKKGNFTRFINHSSKPNIDSYAIAIPKNPYGLEPSPLEIIYFAKKTIYPGEQLLISYEGEENSYWSVLKIKPFPMTPQTFTLTSSLQIKTSS